MTLYAACLSRLGLSQARAADLHGVRPDTVKSWAAGRRAPPQGAYDDLRRYAAQIARRVEGMFDAYGASPEPPGEIDIKVADDPLAQMAAAEFVLRVPAGTVVKTR